MYESFFQLTSRPFSAAPRPQRYYPAASIEAARKTLSRVISRGEGAGLIIGASGTGKSLLAQVLADAFRDELSVVLLSSGRLSSRRALLQAMLHQLEQPFKGLDEGEARLALVDYLTRDETSGEAMLLVVDEAHTLPQRLLEEVRLLSNLAHRGQPRVRLVLAGTPALEERLAGPKLEALGQRIVARCYLDALSPAETAELIHHELNEAGRGPESDQSPPLFDDQALRAVYRATDGIPRLVHQVCDHALVLAFAAGEQQITESLVEEAWADLQQLPLPEGASGDERCTSLHVVEFASLDDSEPDQPGSDASSPSVPQSADAQLDAIERHVGGLVGDDDGEFLPAGTIRPEVELVFPEHGNPFAESFEEEEVVIDHYALLGEAMPGRRRVYSREGRQLGRELTELNPAAPLVSDGGETSSREVRRAGPAHLENAQPCDPAQDPIYPEIPGAAGLSLAEPLEVVDDEDPDLIVVDDALDPPVAHQARLAPVRRQEYGQLFARLRQG